MRALSASWLSHFQDAEQKASGCNQNCAIAGTMTVSSSIGASEITFPL
jgi:hypothetical protein